VLVFELEVNDGVSTSDPDRVVVDVGGTRSVADAGRPVVVSLQDTVFLSGARSTGVGGEPPGDFAWTRVDGGSETIQLSETDSPWTSFSAPRSAATFRLRLEVEGDPDTADEVLVVVARNSSNRGPRARAGGIQAVPQGEEFTLSGDGSTDLEDDPLSHEWLQVSGPPVVLSGAGVSRIGNAPSADEVTRFLLMTHDGRKYGPPDLAAVVSGSTPEPVANAGGDVAGDPGGDVVLDSGASQLPAGKLADAWEWTQITGLDYFDVAAEDGGFDPFGATPTIRVPNTISSLTPDRAFTFALRITDDGGAVSAEDLVTVTFSNLPLNAAPEVVAEGPLPGVRPGDPVTLVGAATDADGDAPLLFNWRQVSGPTVGLVNASQPNASFTAPDFSGELEFTLDVDDGTGTPNSVGTDTVRVLVNKEPVISADVDPASGPEGTLVTLDAGGTTDPDDAVLVFAWREIDVPAAAAPVALSGADTAVATFDAPAYTGTIAQRTRTFELTVTDTLGSETRKLTFVPNRPPELLTISATGSVNISDSTKIRYGSTGASLFAGLATDDDGDPVTIAWSIVSGPQSNASFFSSTTGSNVTFSVPVPTATVQSTGGLYTIGATASDGMETGARKTVRVLAYPSWTNDVYSIISANCTATSCHGSVSSPAGGLYMGTASAAHTNLVGGGRVSPNDSANSLLFQKVNTGQMPKNAAKLPQHLINIISDWIEPDHSGGSSGLSAGAENN
jgi:hypothetical protein